MDKVKHYVIEFLIVFAAFFLQCTVVQRIDLGSVTPNLLVIVTATYGFHSGKKSGIFAGFFCGLFFDIFFGTTIGIYALIYTCLGYLSGLAKARIFRDDFQLAISVIAGADLLCGLACYICFYLLRGHFVFGFALFHVIIPEVLYTSIVAIPVAALLRMILHKLEISSGRRTPGLV